MGLSVDDYRQEMISKYDAPGMAIPEKARFLTELMMMRQASMMDENQSMALDQFLVYAITPKKTDGTPDFEAAEGLFRELSDQQTEAFVEAGGAWQAYLNAQDPRDREYAQKCYCVGGVLPSITMNLSNAYITTPEEYQRELRSYESQWAQYSRDRFAQHPEETWRGYGMSYIDSMPLCVGMRAQEKVATLPDEDQASYKRSGQVEMDEGMNPWDHAESLLRETGTDAVKDYQVSTEQIPMVKDFEAIYDMEALKTYLTTLAETPLVRDSVRYQQMLSSIQNQITTYDKDENRLQFFTGADGYRDGNTFIPVSPQVKESVEKLVRSMSGDIAGRSKAAQDSELRAYETLRSRQGGVKDAIESQRGIADLPEMSRNNRLVQIEQAYHKMQEKDKSGPFHRDSKEYKEMFAAVKAVHDFTEAGYDTKDPIQQARFVDLMAKVNKAANVYAEKEVYGKKKRSSLGMSRKNTALLLLDTTSAGKQPDKTREIDMRDALGHEPKADLDTLISKERAALGTYRSVSEAFLQEGGKKVAKKKELDQMHLDQNRRVQMKEGRLREAHADSIGRVKGMERSLTLGSDPESRRTCFGIDPQFITQGTGMDHSKIDQVPEDQKEIFRKLDKALSVAGNSELVRGQMGGLTTLATVKFMTDHPEATFTQALDPNAFKAEKRKAGMDVLAALEKANGDPPDMGDIAQIVGKGLKLTGDIDMRKEALLYLGKDPNLSPEETREVFRDPANREKMVAFMNAQLSFKQQAFQVLNKPGIKGIDEWVHYSGLISGQAGDEAVRATLKQSNVAESEHAMAYLRAIQKEVPKEVIEAYSTADASSRLLLSAKNLGRYMTGEFSPYEDVQKTAKCAVQFEVLLDQVADGKKLGDPEMKKALAHLTIAPASLGIDTANMDSAGDLVFQPLPEQQMAALKQKIVPQPVPQPIPQAQPVPQAKQPVPPPTLPPEALNPQAPKKEDPKPEESKKAEPKKKESKEAPEKETEKKQTRKRSSSLSAIGSHRHAHNVPPRSSNPMLPGGK